MVQIFLNTSSNGLTEELLFSSLMQLFPSGNIIQELVSVFQTVFPDIKITVDFKETTGDVGVGKQLVFKAHPLISLNEKLLEEKLQELLSKVFPTKNPVNSIAYNSYKEAMDLYHHSNVPFESFIVTENSVKLLFTLIGIELLLSTVSKPLELYLPPFIITPMHFSKSNTFEIHPIVLELLKKHEIPFQLNSQRQTIISPFILSLLSQILFIKYEPPQQVQLEQRFVSYQKYGKNTLWVQCFIIKPTSEHDKIYLVETHLDDVSGEHLGYLFKELYQLGAKDVSAYPLLMKKNRPGWGIRIITDARKLEIVKTALFGITGTLGVRIQELPRHVQYRKSMERTVTIQGKPYTISIKYGSMHPLDYKIEHDSLVKIRQDTNLPFRVIERLIDYQIVKEEKGLES